MVRIGLVGIGFMGMIHYLAARKLQGAHVEAICSRDEKKLAGQSVSYLKQLESPAPLYVFLGHVNGNTEIRLLEVLASVGDAGTIERIKPYTESTDPGIADAAKFAEREINLRIEETPRVEPKRQRKVGTTSEAEPPSRD